MRQFKAPETQRKFKDPETQRQFKAGTLPVI
jgi:hypothetical protein